MRPTQDLQRLFAGLQFLSSSFLYPFPIQVRTFISFLSLSLCPYMYMCVYSRWGLTTSDCRLNIIELE